MPVPPILKNDITRVYYKAAALKTGLDVRFDFWKLNGSQVVNNVVADGEIAGRGVYFYDLATPNEDVYVVGRAYVEGVGEAQPIIFKVGNASPQTLFFYSEEDFTTAPTYRIYNLLGVDLQAGDLINITDTQFWYTPFTAIGGAPALQTDDVFFFEVAEELLAEGFTLDVSSSGLITLQGIATLTATGARITSSAEDKEGQANLEAIATTDISAIIIPKNVIEIEDAVVCNDPLIAAINSTFQSVSTRLNKLRSTQAGFDPTGSSVEVVNILHDKNTIPDRSLVISLTNKISKLGQLVPIIPVGSQVQNDVPLSVSVDMGERLTLTLQTGTPIAVKGGALTFSNKINAPETISGNIVIERQKITALSNITPISVTGGNVAVDNEIKAIADIDNTLKTTLQRKIDALNTATVIPTQGAFVQTSQKVSKNLV